MDDKLLYGVCLWLVNKEVPNVILNGSKEEFDKINPHGKVFRVSDYNMNYYKVYYGHLSFYIIRDAIILVDGSILEKDTKVTNDKNEICKIIDVYWHFKENKAFYYLECNSKIFSKRYFGDDLTII